MSELDDLIAENRERRRIRREAEAELRRTLDEILEPGAAAKSEAEKEAERERLRALGVKFQDETETDPEGEA